MRSLVYILIYGLVFPAQHSSAEIQVKKLDAITINGAKDPNLPPSDPRSRLVGGIEVEQVGLEATATEEEGSGGSESGDDDENAKLSPRSSGTSSGSNNSGGSNQNEISLGFDDQAKQQKPSKPKVTTSKSSSSGKGEAFDKWWPVCAFVDENVPPAKANDALKGLVDKAAACKVNVVVFPFTIDSNYPENEPDLVNEAAKRMCNIPGSGLAKSGSVTTLVNPAHKNTAAEMCKEFEWKSNPRRKEYKKVAGCAELAQNTSWDPATVAAMKAQGHGNMIASNDGMAASIEVESGQTPTTVSHEALGHSMLGKPNGKQHGMGIGEKDDLKNNVGGPDDDWSDSGCDLMRAAAHDNTRRFSWDKNQTTYYVEQTNPQFQLNILNPQPLFTPLSPPPAYSPTAPPIAQGPSIQRIGFDDGQGAKPGSVTSAAPSGATLGSDPFAVADPEATEFDEKHKRKPSDALLSGIRKDKEKADTIDESVDGLAAPDSGKAKEGARIGFDDSAAKNGGGSSVGPDSGGSSESSSSSVSSVRSDSGEVFGPSEEEAGAAPLVSSGPPPPPSIGFDDNASKNGGGGVVSAGSSSTSGATTGAEPVPSDSANIGLTISRSLGSVDPGFSSTFFSGEAEEEKDIEKEKAQRPKPRGSSLRQPNVVVKEGAK